MLHWCVLALVQGLSEFLPISSSAHLILVPVVSGWEDQGLALDVYAHLGSLVAVCCYFRREISTLGRDWLRSVATLQPRGESPLAWALLFGSVPVGLGGVLLHDLVATGLRSPAVIAGTTVVFGILLWVADRWGHRSRGLKSLRAMDIAVIGCLQAVALVPGVSRSGITMTAGLALGLSREASARFSFLLSIPVIAGAAALELAQLLAHGGSHDGTAMLVVASLSALSAYLCIKLFLGLIEQIGMWPFMVYRLLLGVVLLVWLL